MPQLDLFAFSSELFWLVVFFSLFFYLIFKRILPNVYYILKLRNQFHKLVSGSSEKFELSTVDMNKRVEDVGGYTIMVYDLTSRRFKEFRDITTMAIYEVLFLNFIFATFYAFRRILFFIYSRYARYGAECLTKGYLKPKKPQPPKKRGWASFFSFSFFSRF